MLIDEVIITVQAGNGGNGARSFRADGMTAKGGPDGGDGGKGGSIYFIGSTDLSALANFRYKKVLKAEDGRKGARKNMFGSNGKDLIVQVPVGTRITETKTNRRYEITDTVTTILVARGGNGGMGNFRFKSNTHKIPQDYTVGKTGAVKELFLELRIIADIGLIGLPNVGKSSLLSKLTNASPKIGNYAFTTLEPNIGMMGAIGIADIPGLIDGASSGKGLGIKFLKHIEKTKLLLHCIDVTENDILGNYNTIISELKEFNLHLLDKKEIILLTKTDLVDKELLNEKIKVLHKLGKEIQTVSIYDPGSIMKLKEVLYNEVSL